MTKCVYVGPIERLKGKTAIARMSKWAGRVNVQFDDQMLLVNTSESPKKLENRYAFGWHAFPKDNFKPMEEGTL